MDFADEEEDDRFFGDGLTSDQKDILDYVDEINPEEVTGNLQRLFNKHFFFLEFVSKYPNSALQPRNTNALSSF